jgi:hypothetical protein
VTRRLHEVKKHGSLFASSNTPTFHGRNHHVDGQNLPRACLLEVSTRTPSPHGGIVQAGRWHLEVTSRSMLTLVVITVEDLRGLWEHL